MAQHALPHFLRVNSSFSIYLVRTYCEKAWASVKQIREGRQNPSVVVGGMSFVSTLDHIFYPLYSMRLALARALFVKVRVLDFLVKSQSTVLRSLPCYF